jgi:nucleotide-binding universal stress UspA family protein
MPVVSQEFAMSISSIAVHVDSDPKSRLRVELSCKLARQLNAHLIGLGAAMTRLPPDPAGFSLSAEVLALQEQATKEVLGAAEACFRSVILPTDSAEWRGAFDFPAGHVARNARAADLIVIGRTREVADDYLFLDPGESIIRSGRPALVVPPNLAEFPLGSPALVAWKDTREAQRSVADAVPLLCKASRVSIIGVCGEDEGKSEQASLMDVASFLRRHGANVEVMKAEPSEGDAAKTLLTLARLQDAGLVVLGAYGHSRFSEWVFGGVTRAFLRDAPLCCLMSH